LTHLAIVGDSEVTQNALVAASIVYIPSAMLGNLRQWSRAHLVSVRRWMGIADLSVVRFAFAVVLTGALALGGYYVIALWPAGPHGVQPAYLLADAVEVFAAVCLMATRRAFHE
jgi:hypothetical protein